MKKGPRPRGTGGLYLRGGVWWIAYHRTGKKYRESSESTDRKVAEELLKTRLYEVANDKLKARSRSTVEDLIKMALDEAETLKRHSICTLKRRANLHFIPGLGSTLASAPSASEIRKYIKVRQKQRAKSATINRELALLRRSYRLGAQERRVEVVPHIPRLDESDNVRQGYLDYDNYVALRNALPQGLNLLLVVGYHLGCRLGELRRLEWSMVDLAVSEIRIPAAIAKTKKARTVPIYGDMGSWLAAAKARRDAMYPTTRWVFLRHGKRVGGHLV